MIDFIMYGLICLLIFFILKKLKSLEMNKII